MQLDITTTSRQTEDRSWLDEAQHHVQIAGTIDPAEAAWIEADHYPDGYIPSGVAVAYDATANGGNGGYVPYIPTDAGAEGVFAGHVYDSVQVTAAIAATANVGVPILVHGFVDLDALPTNGSSTNGGFGAVTAAAARTEILDDDGGGIGNPLVHLA